MNVCVRSWLIRSRVNIDLKYSPCDIQDVTSPLPISQNSSTYSEQLPLWGNSTRWMLHLVCFSCRVAHSTVQKWESLHQRETRLLSHHGVTSVWVDYLRKALWVLTRHVGATSLEGMLGIVVDQHLYYQYKQHVGSRHQLMMRVWVHNDDMPHVNHYDRSPPNNYKFVFILGIDGTHLCALHFD